MRGTQTQQTFCNGHITFLKCKQRCHPNRYLKSQILLYLFYDAEFVSVEHEAFLYAACSDVEEEFYIGYDEEEFGHVDFKQKRAVETLPDFEGQKNITFPRFYEIGSDAIVGCKRDLPIFIQTFKSLPLEMDAPQTSIYPKDDVELGVQNTLICHATGFYPPSVNISWTKNNVIVTEDISLSQYRPRTDDTFNIFSTLKFTPAEGDIYSCTVNHKALQGQPQTKIWGECLVSQTGLRLTTGLVLGIIITATGLIYFKKKSTGMWR
uniref:HLA class II histocompatibility antigen, DP alpha 1 chain-like n=1 Tax=Sinocyclocheilus rhinocerous TaxID=307959 RepID=A0A673JRG9_9TELE